MRLSTAIGAIAAAGLAGVVIARSALQTPAVRPVDERVLREYTGVYQWEPNAFLYLQIWNEFSGTNQLGAFDESGELRALYPTDRDRFFAGPGAAVATSIESRVEFQRDANGKITSLTWQREGAPPRVARRVDIERHENVGFSNGDVQLAGTLITPSARKKHPAIILVHASGPATREQVLPLARFLVRHGIAVLGYDKRGVGASTGDWNTASFEDLAADVVAAFEYLKTRVDIDSAQIGMLGWSQAGWIMPLAAVRAKEIAFLISVSGAGVPVAETTIDQAQNEMTANGMRPPVIEQVIGLMKLQYRFAQTGQGWDEYAATRAKIAARMGAPPAAFPGNQDHPSWQFMRRIYFYDPAPTLRRLQTPTLAIFGALDNNIMAEKNKAANHLQLEAKAGSNAEMPSLQRFVPEYATTIHDWLAKRVRGYGASR
jgi:pimeloyl-ACP methyl ester carboxylesterase